MIVYYDFLTHAECVMSLSSAKEFADLTTELQGKEKVTVDELEKRLKNGRQQH